MQPDLAALGLIQQARSIFFCFLFGMRSNLLIGWRAQKNDLMLCPKGNFSINIYTTYHRLGICCSKCYKPIIAIF